MQDYANFIGGNWVPAASGATFTTTNPADTRETVARYPLSDAPEFAAATAAAQKAFPAWAALTPVVADFRINWVWMPPWGPDKITDDGRDMLRALGFNL